AELHVYGRGSAKDDLIRLVEELALQEAVHIHAEIPAREIVRVIENADVGVEPKRAILFADEAFSTKIFEYMAMGIPTVASSTKVHRYYLDESLLMFFPDGDSDALARRIIALAKDPLLRARYVQNGLEFIKRNDWETQVPTYLQVLEALTNSPTTRAPMSVQVP